MRIQLTWMYSSEIGLEQYILAIFKWDYFSVKLPLYCLVLNKICNPIIVADSELKNIDKNAADPLNLYGLNCKYSAITNLLC